MSPRLRCRNASAAASFRQKNLFASRGFAVLPLTIKIIDETLH